MNRVIYMEPGKYYRFNCSGENFMLKATRMTDFYVVTEIVIDYNKTRSVGARLDLYYGIDDAGIVGMPELEKLLYG